MRIAYVSINLAGDIISGGVGKKFLTQLRLWKKLGHEGRLFLTSARSHDLPDATVLAFGKTTRLPLLGRVTLEVSRSRRLVDLIHAVQDYQPDIIYFRYGLYTWPLQMLAGIAPLVVELNTVDVAEYRHRGAFLWLLNQMTRSITFRSAHGLVSVSHEIASHPSVAHFGKPMKVISNGMDVEAFEPLPAPQNQRPRLVFVGTPGSLWHGVDKLVELARMRPSLDIDIIGYRPEDLGLGVLPANLHLHGFLTKEQYRQFLAGADVGVGTIALHRNLMEEASTLKVREYLGHGIPVLIGYEDTDLSAANLDYVLQIPNLEDNVQSAAAEIETFARRMMGRRADRDELNALLGQEAKECRRLEFFAQIAPSD